MITGPATIRRLRLAVVSGKGGAGKTTVACGLTRALRAAGHSVTLVDADAEAPDAATVLRVRWHHPVQVLLAVPDIDVGRCDGCGACAAACRFNALAMAGSRPLLFPDLCHGCGTCTLVCKGHGDAIRERPHPIGTVRSGSGPWGALIEARTAIGVPRASRVISAALDAAGSSGVQVIDGPPGTSCSAVAALTGADLALLVVESTPFGRHDAGLMLELLRDRRIPHRAIINRATPSDTVETNAWCEQQDLPVSGVICEDPDLDRCWADGTDPWTSAPAFAATCRAIALHLTTGAMSPC